MDQFKQSLFSYQESKNTSGPIQNLNGVIESENEMFFEGKCDREIHVRIRKIYFENLLTPFQCNLKKNFINKKKNLYSEEINSKDETRCFFNYTQHIKGYKAPQCFLRSVEEK